MVVENMEPQNLSTRERMVTAAESAGADRRASIMRTIDRVLGAPEAIGIAIDVTGERIEDMRGRAERRLTETRNNLTERATRAWDRFTGRVREVRDQAVTRARELGNRALQLGVAAGAGIEAGVVAVCEVPAGIMERAAVGELVGAKMAELGLVDTVMEQMAAVASLDEKQQEALRKILEKQEEARKKLEEKQQEAVERVQDRIDQSRARAAELTANAGNLRAGVEKRRFFKGLLARFQK